ncbi:MAG TPA: preprotein translocase subunit SecA, partial [Prevotellaceae bacterium]|nr:preprotein translocase subunit SecA [Prevotellaceae bacterium]
MNFVSILTKIFGDKKSRDLKAYQPLVEKVIQAYPAVQALTNDELRARVQEIKKGILESAAPLRGQIKQLQDSIQGTPIQDRAPIFQQIDKLEKDVLDTLEKALDEALPEVFAIVKSTAARFAHNEEVVVTANDFDRELAASHDFVDIDGDKAIYHN